MKVGIIDYGMGNLRSVVNAVESLGYDAQICFRPSDLVQMNKLILPGVGAFGDGMAQLHQLGFAQQLEEEVQVKGKQFLGICLGMQILASTGTEYGIHSGLGWISGVVEIIPSNPEDPQVRVPHIGWNDVIFTQTDGLYAGMGESATFYFVHSYVLKPNDPEVVSGICVHGIEFVASVETKNIHAVQYHPEKSQKSGLTVLKNFLSLKD